MDRGLQVFWLGFRLNLDRYFTGLDIWLGWRFG